MLRLPRTSVDALDRDAQMRGERNLGDAEGDEKLLAWDQTRMYRDAVLGDPGEPP